MRWCRLGLGGLVCAMNIAAAPTNLTGLYRVGELGTLDFALQDGRSVGRFKEGGACAFAFDAPVVSGVFEGSVFVGTAMVCQTGSSCEKTKKMPLLGIWHAGSMVASLKLEGSCASPALRNNRLVFLPANVQVLKINALELKNQFVDASEKLANGEFASARAGFQRVLAQDDPTLAIGARMGLGVAQVQLKEYEAAIENLDNAAALALKLKDFNVASDASYNLACAQAQFGRKRDALASLRQAVSLGTPGQFGEQLEKDQDLAPLRAEPEFRKVVAEAKSRRSRK